MTALFNPARHEALQAPVWSDAGAGDALRGIVQSALDAFTPSGLWPAHPRDNDVPLPRHAALYDGAGGAIWTLRHLATAGAIDLPLPAAFNDVVLRLVDIHRAESGLQEAELRSFLLGDAGLLLLQWQQTHDASVADRLHAVIQANQHNPTLEQLWGASGTALVAIHMAEATGEPRWQALVADAAQALLSTLETDPETGTPIWTQDMYGKQVRYLGAGHGLVGNIYPAVRGAALLAPATAQHLLRAGLQTLQVLALHDTVDGVALVNWHPMSDRARAEGRLPLVQDCHGAPGVLLRLADAPRTSAWDSLLRGAAELTWLAGPLRKGPSLCHGTAGSALALLKLARRFGEAVWLDRARAFAMHAAAQVEQERLTHGQGRHTLWTGDLGVACVLWACISGDDRLPTCDVF